MPKGAPAQAAPGKPWPFSVNVLDLALQSDYNSTVTMGAGAQRMQDVKIQPQGWLRGIWFDVNGVCTANTATVTFNGDAAAGTGAPFTAINNVQFSPTAGTQVFGPFNGYDWMTTNKFGGYHNQGDPRADYNYSTTTGTGSSSSGGSFHFTLYLPLEITQFDSFGDLENKSENANYRVQLTLEQSSVVYATAPTNLPAVTIQTTQDSYTQPVAAMALKGRPVADSPPAKGTYQFWNQEQDTNVTSGVHPTLLTNGLGNPFRNLIFKLVRTSGTRANGTADWPSPQEIVLGTQQVRNVIKATWQDRMSRVYGFSGATTDAANSMENGVFVLPYNVDMGLKPGNEARRKYQRTESGQTYRIKGSYGNAGTLYVTENFIIPKGGQAGLAAVVV